MTKLKICSYVALCIGAILTLASTVLAFIFISSAMQNEGIAIIGGADIPTALIIFSILGEYTLYPFIIGITLVIGALFCLIFRKTTENNCTLKTTMLSLAISFIGAAGLCCVYVYGSIAAFHEFSKHPIAYPMSIGLGLLALALFVILIAFYCISRKDRFSVKGLIVDIFTSILCLPSFLLVCIVIGNMLEGIIHTFW